MDKTKINAVVAILLIILAGAVVHALIGHENASETTPERIGIIGAMESEIVQLKDEMTVKETHTVAGMTYYVGTMKGHDVVVVQCGMGKVNAGICANTLINQFNVKTVINSGVAGTLDPELEVGDFVISTDAVQHDFDVSPIGFKPGEIPYTGKVSFEADGKLVELAYESLKENSSVKVVKGRICSGDQFIITQEQKDTITSKYGGECCEMEGAAVAQACYLNGVPFVIIRGMSDGGDGKEFADYQEEIAHTVASAVIDIVEKL